MKREDSVKLKFKVMFEKRPIWGLIVGLNICILIWLVSVQQPVVFDSGTAVLSSSNSYVANAVSGAEELTPVVAASVARDGNGWGRDLLSKPMSVQSNEEYQEDHMSVAVSTLTTLGLSKNHNNNGINKNQSSMSSKESNTFLKNVDVRSTTKTSDLSSELQSLTSSLGTGMLSLNVQPTPSWAKLTAVASALPEEDFNQLIDLHNFQFLMPQPVCGSHIEALILIHSAPKNQKKRQVIRETWASITHHTTQSPLRVLFLLGAVSNQQVQADLQNENNIHRDIIQGSFVDDYRNMTYKHIMAFKWFLYNCPQAQILIKVDDDVYVNTPLLIKYLKAQQQQQQQQDEQQPIIMNDSNNDNPTIDTTVTPNKTTATTTTITINTNKNTTINTNTTTTTDTSASKTSFSIFHKFNIFASATPSTLLAGPSLSLAFNASQELFNHPQNLLFCQKIVGSLVKRSYRSKWRVSFKEYSDRYYPPYCPGYAIIYSPDIIFRLYTAAQNSKYFWIDDVHITGVLAQQTNTTITTSSHYVLYSDECDQILTGKTDLSKMEFLFAWQSISAQKIKLLWHLQMMSLPAADDLHYRKTIMNNNVYEKQHQRKQKQEQHYTSRNYDQYNVDNGILSSHTYTSAQGFR